MNTQAQLNAQLGNAMRYATQALRATADARGILARLVFGLRPYSRQLAAGNRFAVWRSIAGTEAQAPVTTVPAGIIGASARFQPHNSRTART